MFRFSPNLEVFITNLLLRLFVKDFADTDNPQVRSAIGRLSGAVGIGCNLLLFLMKLRFPSPPML